MDDEENDKLVLLELCDVLRAISIVKMTIEYDGSSDDGCMGVAAVWLAGVPPIRYVLGESAEGTKRLAEGVSDTVTLSEDIRSQIEDFCWGILEEKAEGWENNEGAYGTFTLDVIGGTLLLEHSQRVIDTIESEYEFTAADASLYPDLSDDERAQRTAALNAA